MERLKIIALKFGLAVLLCIVAVIVCVIAIAMLFASLVPEFRKSWAASERLQEELDVA